MGTFGKPMIRIGHGYDLHRLVPGRPLWLGAVELPYERGLLGHSDGDVACHAIADALLGAAALGDIGHHFPDTDPACAGIAGAEILRRTVTLLTQGGWRVSNVDTTVIAEAPRLAPHIITMRGAIAAALGVEPSRVSVKATTHEGLGATGTGDAIAAHAVCLLHAAAPHG